MPRNSRRAKPEVLNITHKLAGLASGDGTDAAVPGPPELPAHPLGEESRRLQGAVFEHHEPLAPRRQARAAGRAARCWRNAQVPAVQEIDRDPGTAPSRRADRDARHEALDPRGRAPDDQTSLNTRHIGPLDMRGAAVLHVRLRVGLTGRDRQMRLVRPSAHGTATLVRAAARKYREGARGEDRLARPSVMDLSLESVQRREG